VYAQLLEAIAKLRYERFSELGVPVAIEDQRMLVEARIAIALGATPLRVSLLAQRRTRSGFMGGARAERAETTLGVELGATY
jgi:hypothetical protein